VADPKKPEKATEEKPKSLSELLANVPFPPLFMEHAAPIEDFQGEYKDWQMPAMAEYDDAVFYGVDQVTFNGSTEKISSSGIVVASPVSGGYVVVNAFTDLPIADGQSLYIGPVQFPLQGVQYRDPIVAQPPKEHRRIDYIFLGIRVGTNFLLRGGYGSGGGSTVGADYLDLATSTTLTDIGDIVSPSWVPWNKSNIKTSAFTHSVLTNPEVITFARDGRYVVDVQTTGSRQNTGSLDGLFQMVPYHNVGSGWQSVDDCWSYAVLSQQLPFSYGTANSRYVYDYSAGHTLRIGVINGAPAGGLTKIDTLPLGCRLSIVSTEIL